MQGAGSVLAGIMMRMMGMTPVRLRSYARSVAEAGVVRAMARRDIPGSNKEKALE